MKTVFSSIVFLLVWAGRMHAQNVPFPESNAVWKASSTTIAGPIFTHFALCGDTTINGTSYSKVLELQTDSALNILNSTYQGGIRSNGELVRFLPNDGSPELLLYNFGLQPGQTISLTLPFWGNTIVRAVDSVKVETLAGKPRKVIYFAPGFQGAPVETWIAGVGSSYGLLTRGVDPGADLGFHLECFQYDEEYLNLSLTDCFLPQLPTECAVLNAGKDVKPTIPLQLTAQPNPTRPIPYFVTNLPQLPEPCDLKLYAANGKLLSTVANYQTGTALPGNLALAPGFYIATLESGKTERVLAHCTFVVGD